jgi:hypothetical protein
VSAEPVEVPRVTEAQQVLRRAESLVTGDRRQDYGEATASFESLALMWGVICRSAFSAHEVALCLAALKLWRCSTSPSSMDSWTDLAGYAALGWEVSVAEAKEQGRE